MKKLTLSLILTCICSTFIINANAGKWIDYAEKGKPTDKRWVSEYVPNVIFTKQDYGSILPLASELVTLQQATAASAKKSKEESGTESEFEKSDEFQHATTTIRARIDRIKEIWDISSFGNTVIGLYPLTEDESGVDSISLRSPNDMDAFKLAQEISGKNLTFHYNHKGEEIDA